MKKSRSVDLRSAPNFARRNSFLEYTSPDCPAFFFLKFLSIVQSYALKFNIIYTRNAGVRNEKWLVYQNCGYYPEISVAQPLNDSLCYSNEYIVQPQHHEGGAKNQN